MKNTKILFFCFSLVLIIFQNNVLAEQGLIGWWPLDRVTSGITPDESGFARNGTFVGSCQLISDPQRGSVLQIDSTTNSWVNCGGGGIGGWASLPTVSISAWVKIDLFQCPRQIIASKGTSYMVSRFGSAVDTNHLGFWTDGFGNGYSGHHDEIEGKADIQDGQWHHVVFTYNKATGARYLYVDCRIDASGSYVVLLAQNTNDFLIGGSTDYPNSCWKGLIDDVRLYNIALSNNQIRNLYGGDYSLNPSPEDETGNLPITTKLSWQPNLIARPVKGQDIYFGTNFYDVQNSLSAVHIGLQDSNSFDPGTLKSATTYYWKVDQVDDANNIHPGFVWSFRTETQGYYMDLFKDSGIQINTCTEMPAANLLALSFERLAVENSGADQAIQDSLVIGNSKDDNGVYLYPDGQPRFRCIYVAGGGSQGHGTSYGAIGRQRINQFFDNGGSYSGSCAGAFITSMGVGGNIYNQYFHLWPAFCRTQSGIFLIDYDIPGDSPLLNYYDFAGGEGDLHIDNLQHWNGPYLTSDNPTFWAPGSQALARFDYTRTDKVCAGNVSVWAWKKNDQSGRLVPMCSHPERVPLGKQRDLMAGILRYALDGNGQPKVKAALQKGLIRIMNDNAHAGFEKIGDKQYHHFTIQIPPTDHNDLKISLFGDGIHDLNLYAKPGDFAFENEDGTIEALNGHDSNETIVIKNPQSGTWYIGVKGVETVQRTLVDWGWDYTGNTDVLNGVAYSVGIDVRPPLDGDLDNDGYVNTVDLKTMSQQWLNDNNLLVPRGSLLGQWNFDNSNADDTSGNDHNGFLAGDAIIVTDPEKGLVLQLDGDGDYVDLGNGEWTNPGNHLTLTAWFKVGLFDVSFQTIIAKGLYTYRLGRTSSGNNLQAYIDYTASHNYQSATASENVNDGLWHHVAVTYDGSLMKIFIDGLQQGNTSVSNLNTNTVPLMIGRNSDSPGRDWQGWIDDVRFYDYPLDADDIKTVYSGGQLVNKYQCSGQIVSDLNGDCIVNFFDFVIMADDWLK